jgi:hypothetical protein
MKAATILVRDMRPETSRGKTADEGQIAAVVPEGQTLRRTQGDPGGGLTSWCMSRTD